MKKMKSKKGNKSVFFDIDGCLIDENYKTNIAMDIILREIEAAKEKGIIFNLNSNRSFESMIGIYKLFGFNGDMICECSSYIYKPDEDRIFNTESYELLDREKLNSELGKITRKLYYVNTSELDDAIRTEFDRTKKDGLYIFLEKSRISTMTIYPRQLEDKTYFISNLDDIFELLISAYPDYDIDKSKAYGSVMLTPKGLEKGSLLEGYPGPIFSFGDTEQDISMFEKSDYCGTPANARDGCKEAVRKLGGMVSEFDYTKGSLDFIKEVKGW